MKIERFSRNLVKNIVWFVVITSGVLWGLGALVSLFRG
jgi:hypothetical protein